MKSNRNALVHGVYSSDIIMPWERPEDFDALLNGIRRDFKPRGTTEDDIVFDIAVLHWRKRRVNWLLQFEFVDAQFAGEVEKSGKRSVDDIRRSIETRRVKKGREKVKYTSAVVGLSEAVTSLAYELKKNTSLGKLGANMRSVVDDIEKLRPIIEAGAKSVDEAKKIDGACNLDTIGSACELEARLDALIDKKIQRLIVIREFQRQYGQDSQDSNVKLIEHHSHGSAAEKAVAKEGGRKTSTKKSMDINDNWNDNNNDNDNDNDNDNNNEDNYDWEHEYDQALAEQKKGRPKRRAARD
jgi:hypothetical protein